MKVSEHWLRTLVNPSLSAQALADQLTNAGIEIDGIECVNDNKGALVWTLKIPPNRGDCLSMEGIAREVSLLNHLAYSEKPVTPISANTERTISVHIENPALCPRYMGAVLCDINPSAVIPSWLRERLAQAGMPSGLSIVDILNYVMLETGQPLHAFDLNTIDQKISVRAATSGEKLQLLGNQEITLQVDTLVIADSKGVQAIAGVIGGSASAVTEHTNAIWLESAYFDPVAIRLASKQYGIKTEAAYRFERGVDPALPKRALLRAIELLVQITGAKNGVIFEKTHAAFLPFLPVIILRKERILKVLGLDIPGETIKSILQQGGMQVTELKQGYEVTPPSFRQDIAIEEDLIEEIARVYGFDRFPPQRMIGPMICHVRSETHISEQQIKEVLIARGYHEAITYSFIDPKIAAFFSSNTKDLSLITLVNAIASDMAVMRESLWPGLLQALKYNLDRQQTHIRLFEVGTCFKAMNGKIIETLKLAGVCVGSPTKEQWGISPRPLDFYDLKGDIEALLSLAGKKIFTFDVATKVALHPGKGAKILHEEREVGVMGALHPSVSKSLSLEQQVFLFELDLEGLTQKPLTKFRPLSKFPSIRRDIAIVVDKAVLAGELKAMIVKTAGELLEDVFIFDVFQGKGMTETQKSIALGLILRHLSRTLVEGEVSDTIQKVLSMLKSQFQATLRE